MEILKNKHLMIAALVAPLLALMSYFAIDAWMSESPHVAEEGQSYKLAEKSNCRWDSGSCGLKNGDFELDLSFEWLDEGRMLLKLESVFPLEGVKIALVENEADEKQPLDMQSIGDTGTAWSLHMARPDPERNRLHLVASANRSLYFGDVSTRFTLEK